MCLIVESQYFPPVDTIKNLCNSKDAKIEQYEYFRKGGFRNRCMVLGANGIISLTVPIAGGRGQKLLMKDIRVDYSENWQRSHIRTLSTSYNKSPFYGYYKREVEALISHNAKYMVDLNFKILEVLVGLLRVHINLDLTTEFKPQYDNDVDHRNKLSPKNFQTDTDHLPRYAQVFADKFGFQSNLSILDLLFCEGPNATNLLND